MADKGGSSSPVKKKLGLFDTLVVVVACAVVVGGVAMARSAPANVHDNGLIGACAGALLGLWLAW